MEKMEERVVELSQLSPAPPQAPGVGRLLTQ